MKKDYIGLNLGCGPNILDGWYNTDIQPIDERVDYLDASKPFPIEDESFNFIFSEHMFEHLTYQQGKNMLSECYRVLKPGGVLRLSLPTLGFLFNLYMLGDNVEGVYYEYIKWAMESFDESGCLYDRIIDKSCFVINNFYRLWGHKMIYSSSAINEMLHNAGFKLVLKSSNYNSDYPELCDVNGHGKQIPVQFNDIETTTFEAHK